MVEVACEARGGYPTTYDTDGIDVGKRFLKRHAIFLAGGDVYGLDSPIGIRKYLLEKGVVSKQAGGQMPLIVGATIYDMWRANIEKVELRAPRVQGVHAGLDGSGAGRKCWRRNRRKRWRLCRSRKAGKGGTGSCAMKLVDDIYVGALMITNSMGNIRNPDTGEILAGATDEKGKFIEFESVMENYVRRPKTKENTTIGIVATNAELSHEELIKMVQMAHDGLPMAIRPTHTTSDGDTLFADIHKAGESRKNPDRATSTRSDISPQNASQPLLREASTALTKFRLISTFFASLEVWRKGTTRAIFHMGGVPFYSLIHCRMGWHLVRFVPFFDFEYSTFRLSGFRKN